VQGNSQKNTECGGEYDMDQTSGAEVGRIFEK
jgi:hypothetical protein